MIRLPKRIAELVEKYLDGSLDPRGRQELLGCIRDDADMRQRFLEELDFSNLVSELYRADDFTLNTVERILWTQRMPKVQEGKSTSRRPRRRPLSENRSSWSSWALLAAALLFAVAMVAVLRPSRSGSAEPQKVNEARRQTWNESTVRRQTEREAEGHERVAAGAEEKRRDAEAPRRNIEEKPRALTPPDIGPADDPRALDKRREERDAPGRRPERTLDEPRAPGRPAETVERPAPGAMPRDEKTPPAPSAPAAPSPRVTHASVARAEEVEGEAFRVTKDGTVPLGAGADVLGAEGLETRGGSSRLALRFPDKTRVDLGPDTLLAELAELAEDSGKRLLVSRGSLRAVVAKQPKEQPMIIATPHGQITVLGTTFRLRIDPDPAKGTRLDVEEGSVELKNLAGKTVQVESGHYAIAAAGMDLAAKPLAFWEGALAVYLFNEGRGSRVHDLSRKGSPLDLKIDNEYCVRWLPKGLAITHPTLIASTAPARKIVDPCKLSNELTLEVWFRPATLATGAKDQRIVTLAVDTGNQNFLLGQDGVGGPPNSYVMRFRTTATDLVGKPQLDSPDGTAALRLTQVVYSRSRSGAAVLYVDGAEVARATVAGNLSAWNDGYRLGLGNELSYDRPWLGEYHLAAFYSRALGAEEVREHYRAGVE
jgi:hypothetical protein